MSRVLFLYRVKQACFSPWTKLVFFLSLVLTGWSVVSVSHVLANLGQQEGLFDGSRYLIYAVAHTEHLVQIVLVGLVLLGLLLARDGVKNLRTHRHLAAI